MGGPVVNAPLPQDRRPLPAEETSRRALVVVERIRAGNLEPFVFGKLCGLELPATREGRR